MAKLYVYDSYENRMLVYNNLNENDPMPYSYGSTLSVREFRGSSNARVLWTTTRAMEAWNLTRRRYGAGIPVGPLRNLGLLRHHIRLPHLPPRR